ncbi:hypothetical protein [Olleya marilimosa]|uniref:hypothetical protein n=1 Tax=Olleya marilimosa TaxID=272164 RepID=UPI000482A7E1|nr:hypothetical protein [Olleya marilimosa]
MEQEIFELLLEIRKNGSIKDLPSTRINVEQRKLDTEKERRFNVLIKHGLISNNGNSVFIITEYGYDVSEHKSWKDYLEHRSNVNKDKTNKEKYDLKISKFQAKFPRLPYYLSSLGLILSVLAILNSFYWNSKNVEEKELQKTKSPTLHKKQDTTLSKYQKEYSDTIYTKK